jgi:hypothetical protein
MNGIPMKNSKKNIRLFLIGLAVALVDLGIFLGQAVMR